MDIQFVKLHSAGRDFILVDGLKDEAPDDGTCARLAEAMTHRMRGIGGFALVVLTRGDAAPVAARVYGAEEAAAIDLPDALLCSARYAFDCGLLGGPSDRIETGGNTFSVALVDRESVLLDIGPPMHWRESDELGDSPQSGIDEQVRLKDRNYSFSALRLLGLHSVFFDMEEGIPIARLRRLAARHPGFAVQPLVERVRVHSPEEMQVRIWSPREGELLSSASGNGAAVVAAVVHGFTERECVVRNRGGETYIRWDERSGHVLCTTTVEYTFMGTYYWES